MHASVPTKVCGHDTVSCPTGIQDLRAARREQGCVVAASGMAPSDPVYWGSHRAIPPLGVAGPRRVLLVTEHSKVGWDVTPMIEL